MRQPLTVVLALLVASPPLAAQRVRVRSTTTIRYVELLPVRLDSSGDFTPAERQSATPLTEDLELSAWGLGVTGLRAYGLLRLRGALGSELVWPRYGDHVDALHAYVELERPRWRLRAGRQQRVSSLGLQAFDGASGLWRFRPNVRFEAFIGRGLARGFLEPASSDAIRSIEPLQPAGGTLVVGGSAWTAPARGWSAALSWQREDQATSGPSLVSERVGVDAQGRIGRRLSVAASIDGDLAAEAVGRARLALRWNSPRGFAELEWFRYRPLFDLNTIWGAFAPEANHGVGARAEVPVVPGLTAHGRVTRRRYRPAAQTSPFFAAGKDRTTTLSLGARWAGAALGVDGSWRWISGYGGAQSAADLAVTWTAPDERWTAGAQLTAFEEEEQFRVADGLVTGLAVHASARVTPRLLLRAEASRYRHRPEQGDVLLDWSQTRALLSVEWTFGASADRVGSYR